MITEEELMKTARHKKVDNDVYFPIIDIGIRYGDIKFYANDIRNLDYDGEILASLRVQDVALKTEFDKNIQKTLNFNPKGK